MAADRQRAKRSETESVEGHYYILANLSSAGTFEKLWNIDDRDRDRGRERGSEALALVPSDYIP